MNEGQKSGGGERVDPDDATELTDAFFDHADIYKSGKLVRRGRPKLESPKAQVTLRLDADVLAGLREPAPTGNSAPTPQSSNGSPPNSTATQQRN
jgi:hypothetical protein